MTGVNQVQPYDDGEETETEDENDYFDDPERYAIEILQSRFLPGITRTKSYPEPPADVEEHYRERIAYHKKTIAEQLKHTDMSDVVGGRHIRFNICMEDLYVKLLDQFLVKQNKKQIRKRRALKRLETYNKLAPRKRVLRSRVVRR